MNETIGWLIYAVACAVFTAMAVAKKERRELDMPMGRIHEIDDVWHDLYAGDFFKDPPQPLTQAETKALLEQAMAKVNAQRHTLLFLEHGTAKMTPEMERELFGHGEGI